MVKNVYKIFTTNNTEVMAFKLHKNMARNEIHYEFSINNYKKYVSNFIIYVLIIFMVSYPNVNCIVRKLLTGVKYNLTSFD